MSSIRISQLNNLSPITSDDFFPIVDSGSMTTYHTPISVVNAFWSTNGSASFASVASSSVNASSSVSSSYALTSSNAITSSNSITSSFTFNASNAVSASYAISSSYAINSTSASYSLTSSWGINAINAISATSASYASASTSASYALTSSVALKLAPSSGSVPWYFEKSLRVKFASAMNDAGNITGSAHIKAEALVLTDNYNNWVCLNDVDITASRATGLARGLHGWLEPNTSYPMTRGTWYDVWVLYNPTNGDYGAAFAPSGSTTNNHPRVSTASIDSVLPTGYTYKRMVASVRAVSIEDPNIVFARWVEYSQPNRHNWHYSASYFDALATVDHYLPNITVPYRYELSLQKMPWGNGSGTAAFATDDQVSSKQVYWLDQTADAVTSPAYSVVFNNAGTYTIYTRTIVPASSILKVLNPDGSSGTFLTSKWAVNFVIYAE